MTSVEFFLKNRFTGISNVHEIGKGHFSQAFAYEKNQEKLIIRIAETDHDFKKDQLISAQLQHPAVPIPMVFEIGPYEASQFYCITQYCPGKTFDSLSPQEQDAGIPALLETLDGIHQMDISETTGFGLIDLECNGTSSSWEQHLLNLENHKVPYDYDQLYSRPYFDRAYLDRHFEHLNTVVESLPKVRALVHGDFGFDNLIMDQGTVTGVLDWAEARIGDPIYDLAWLNFWTSHPTFSQKLIQQPTSQDFSLRLLSCSLHIGIHSMLFAAHNHRESDYHSVVTRLNQIVQRFG